MLAVAMHSVHAALDAMPGRRPHLLPQDTAHVMSKVDKLLGEVRAGAGAMPEGADGSSGPSAPPPEELEARCRLLDRVASEVSRLQFYAARGGELEFMRQLQPRIDGAAAALQVGAAGVPGRPCMGAGSPRSGWPSLWMMSLSSHTGSTPGSPILSLARLPACPSFRSVAAWPGVAASQGPARCSFRLPRHAAHLGLKPRPDLLPVILELLF